MSNTEHRAEVSYMKVIALFIRTSNVPINLVKNAEFKELLQELDTFMLSGKQSGQRIRYPVLTAEKDTFRIA